MILPGCLTEARARASRGNVAMTAPAVALARELKIAHAFSPHGSIRGSSPSRRDISEPCFVWAPLRPKPGNIDNRRRAAFPRRGCRRKVPGDPSPVSA